MLQIIVYACFPNFEKRLLDQNYTHTETCTCFSMKCLSWLDIVSKHDCNKKVSGKKKINMQKKIRGKSKTRCRKMGNGITSHCTNGIKVTIGS